MEDRSLWAQYPRWFCETSDSAVTESEVTNARLQKLDEPKEAMCDAVNARIDAVLKICQQQTAKERIIQRNKSHFSIRRAEQKKEEEKVVAKIVARKVKLPRPPLCQGYHVRFDHNPGMVMRTVRMQDGTKKTYYRTGDVRYEKTNGRVVTVHGDVTFTKFPNGDQMQEFPDGVNAYKYASSGAVELRLLDGSSVIDFSDGRREKRMPTGEILVALNDGTTTTFASSRPTECREIRSQ